MTTDDQAWREWRRGGVGASDVAALIGLSAYASPTSLFYSKLGLLDEPEETQRQRIGKRMEALLAAEFHDETGLYVVGEQMMCTHPEHTFARCTLDGLVAEAPADDVDLEACIATWEAKSDGRFAWPDGIPHNIRAQCVFQMGVTGMQHCFLTVIFAGFRIEHHEVDFDDDARADWEFMLEAARSFWFDNIMLGTPPPVDDHWATTEALTQVHRDPQGMLDADDRARDLVATVQRAMTITAAAEATEKRLKNELRAVLGDKTDLIDGWVTKGKRDPKQEPVVLASWREQQSQRIDPDEVRRLDPLLAAKCTKSTTSRVLRVAKAKENSE